MPAWRRPALLFRPPALSSVFHDCFMRYPPYDPHDETYTPLMVLGGMGIAVSDRRLARVVLLAPAQVS